MKKNKYGLNVGVCLALALTTGACIDHDYDLSEDIDLTVNVGGESFTIPKSSTDLITLSQVLSLDEGSSIKAVSQGQYGLNEGDYVLVQSGNPTHSDFQIGDVVINNLSNNRVETDEIQFTYPGNFGISQLTLPVPEVSNSINISRNDVTTDLVSLSKIGMDMTVKVQLSTSFVGKATIDEGYTVTFDPTWRISSTTDFVDVIDGHILKFNRAVAINNGNRININLNVNEIDLSSVPAGEGLYAPGHFSLNSSIKLVGNLTVSDLSNIPAGTKGSIKLAIDANVQSAKITSITGVVNPKITINDTRFDINDIPDFLSDDQNSLDVENPRFYVTVSNNSPVQVELNAQLESFKGSQSLAVAGIGAKNGTTPVIIGANGATKLLISQKPISSADATNIVVSNLSDLIKTIPDYMVFGNISCEVVQQTVELALNPRYEFDTDYEAVVPLSFGPAMRLHYTHEEKDWDVDDMQKYNFKTVELSFTAINAIPLSMTPEVKALNKNGEEINDVIVNIQGSITAGTVAAPSSNPLKILITSQSSSLKNLDGVRLIFDATSDQDYVGANLNKEQSLKFTDITATIYGGVTIDLN